VGAKVVVLLLAICLPLRQIRVSSGFGYRIHPFTGTLRLHAGVDLEANRDTVFAIADGRVTGTGYNGSLGCYIRIRHPGNIVSTYGHLFLVGVQVNDTVNAGEPIGLSGATGLVTGPHLHFALAYQGHYIDPLAFLLEAEKSINYQKTKP
jgi:murein DD-endopeptidase MepM/ murein hydrolase activator NlpD